jgi:hydroxymethylpyrimidine pyrophosphatase-like HAD family hydrolase
VYYAGDGGNDIPGFNISYKSFAPVTASKHVKSYADRIIDTKENGVLFPILQEAEKV